MENPGVSTQAGPSSAERAAFRRELRPLRSEVIRDNVLASQYGDYNPEDPRRSHWKAREANRVITERNRAAELRPQWVAIIVSTILSLAALVVAILAYMKQT